MPTLRLFSYRLQFSSNTILVLATGFSLAVLAGYFLNRRRKRYRAVSTVSHVSRVPSYSTTSLQRSSTFSVGDEPGGQPLVKSHFPPSSLSNTSDDGEFMETTDVPESAQQRQRSMSVSSQSSSDSFHSTVDLLLEAAVLPLGTQLYQTGLDKVSRGLVVVRTMRTRELLCSSDVDFLAKLYCVRLAFDELVSVSTNRDYFQQSGKELMANFLSSMGQNPALFCDRFDSLLACLEEEGWRQAEEELKKRSVMYINVYDVAMDFILLDAFTDLENPPSTVTAVLNNQWITDGMKKATLSAAVWSLLKAKRTMLKNKSGFMAHFYLLSEVLTPVMVWGFLGTDRRLRNQCHQLKDTITEFLQSIFSLEAVRYSTVATLADDILTLSQHTAQAMAVV